ncbi:MAG: AmmeMemoRadiSam system protein B [Bacteroidales bacterium]|nr:AmmeMemoRadiSam system protein B [Bacteroidales bacterium]
MNPPDSILIDRKPAVAGQFYPAEAKKLELMVAGYLKKINIPSDAVTTQAIITPHAGFVFSGQVAAAAFRQIDPNKAYKTVFLIGCSHRSSFAGGSVYTEGNFITPLGKVEVDLELSRLLAKDNPFLSFNPAYHNEEHCLEVQLPFLQQTLLKPFRIVPILLGTRDKLICKRIAETLKPYFREENLFIISSDFSHYPSYSDANKVDKVLADAIQSNDPSGFILAEESCLTKSIPNLATGCCSWPAILTLLYMTENDTSIVYKQIMYRNSGDSDYGDHERVVGYHAISIKRMPKDTGFSLSKEEQQMLLSIARNTIKEYLNSEKILKIDTSSLLPGLKQLAGAFVTLRKNGSLRGCIGRLEFDKPLFHIVQEMSVAASVSDYRFSPLEPEELESTELEISVLTPLKKIRSISEIQLGRDGIYIKKGNHAGTFLPSVATDTKWSLEEFLGHCSRDKAGIGWDGWKDRDTEIFIYQAFSFGEGNSL